MVANPLTDIPTDELVALLIERGISAEQMKRLETGYADEHFPGDWKHVVMSVHLAEKPCEMLVSINRLAPQPPAALAPSSAQPRKARRSPLGWRGRS